MKNISLFLIFSLFSLFAVAQRIHIGVFGGAAAYNGDLTEKIFPKKVTNGAIGITANYEFADRIMFRVGYTYAIVGGADRYSEKSALLERNLSFETEVSEFSFVGEYYLFNLYDRRISPYGFAGLAYFSFNPYTFNGSSQKIYLPLLATEGQGVAGYSLKRYKLSQFAVPFGGGVKFAVNNNIRIGAEMGMRKLFTDYFDDVSGNYADPAELLAAKGQLSVDLSYRGDEVPGGSTTYPTKGAQRGSPKSKDWYYFAGLHLTYGLGGGNAGSGFTKKKSRLGCPTNVY